MRKKGETPEGLWILRRKHVFFLVFAVLVVATAIFLSPRFAWSGIEAPPVGEVVIDYIQEEVDSLTPEQVVTLEAMFFEEMHHTKRAIVDYAVDDSAEVECLITAIFFEAGGESYLGKRWVFDVIDNRRRLGYRGKHTFCDVIYDRWQFSFANMNPDRVPTYNKDLYDTKRLVKSLYFDWDRQDQTDCATHYLAYDIVDPMDVTWARLALEGRSPENLVWKGTIGGHMFFGPANGC